MLETEEVSRAAEMKARLQLLDSSVDEELRHLELNKKLTITEARLNAIKTDENVDAEQILGSLPAHPEIHQSPPCTSKRKKNKRSREM